MKLGLKEKEFQLKKDEPHMNDTNITESKDLIRNNDQSSTKDDENNIIFDEPIEYCSSPKIGLVSIHGSRNKNNRYIKLTEVKTDIPNTISMYVRQVNTNAETENNINFFNKKQQTHLKQDKKKDKKPVLINSYSNMNIKSIQYEKNNGLYKKRMTKKFEKIKNMKKWDKTPKDKEKQFKRKSTSYPISALSEKINKIKNNLNRQKEIKEKSKEENIKSDEEISKSKSRSKAISKEKEETDKSDNTPNIIIYGSESSSEIKEENNQETNEDKNENDDNFLKTKNLSNISTGNANNTEKTESKILKPRSKPSSNAINRIKIKNKKSQNFTSSNITNKIKLNNNSKYSSANDNEKNNTKDKNKKKFSLLKLLTTKNLFKDDKDSTNKMKPRNSVTKHILSIQQYNQFALKKNSGQSTKDMKDNMKSSLLKPNSDISLKLDKVEEFHKKSNKNLHHSELEKNFVKKNSYNSNVHIPRITINTKKQENDNNDIHLVVKGKEEIIKNFTNQQMIEDEKDYMIDCLKVLAKIKKEEMPRCKQKVNFNFPPEEKQKKIALFDLDETLVHCMNNEKGMNGDVISVKLPTNKTVKVGLNIRNNWQKAIDLIKNHYHIVVYTASHPSYADAVLDYLDKDNKYFKYRLYRNHCIQCDVDGFKFYVKDLDTLDKYYNLKDIVIIDNSILSFAYHLYNGIPIVPFIDQANDTELMLTAHYLVSIANYDDLSLENKKHLNLDNLLSQAKILNEIEDNEEEEVEDEEGKVNIIKLENNVDKKESTEESNKQIKNENLNKNENGENKGDNKLKIEITQSTNNKGDNNEGKKFTGRCSIKKSRKTIKIAENMKKNLDEMIKKKNEELQLEKIDED